MLRSRCRRRQQRRQAQPVAHRVRCDAAGWHETRGEMGKQSAWIAERSSRSPAALAGKNLKKPDAIGCLRRVRSGYDARRKGQPDIDRSRSDPRIVEARGKSGSARRCAGGFKIGGVENGKPAPVISAPDVPAPYRR